ALSVHPLLTRMHVVAQSGTESAIHQTRIQHCGTDRNLPYQQRDRQPNLDATAPALSSLFSLTTYL
ncbi:MAG TPA: hypothetical protein ACQGQX_06445, partial [Xylella taiwanensis]